MNRLITVICFIFIVFTLQAQVSKTVSISAGGLSKALSAEEKNTITHLTITGTTDARDFKTMRDSMSLIAVVDMSGASISAYTGTSGTSTFSTNYPANCIPESAFYLSIWKTSLTSFKMPSSLTAIGSMAFNGCRNLQTVVIPSLVTTIGSSAFMYCSGLSSISIPASVTTIASSSAFAYCKGDVTVHDGNPNYSSADGVLFNKTKTVLIHCPASKTGNYNIPSTVTTLSDYAFANCTGLTSISIPTTITSIGYEAFYQCTKLTSLTLPPNLTLIESNTFTYCQKLTSIEIPSQVTRIGYGAFFDCRGLTSITIPISVTKIEGTAFAYCSGLTSIYVDSPSPVDLSTINEVFEGINKTTCRLYVPYMTSELYDISNQWGDFENIIERPGFYLPDTRADILSTEGSIDSLHIFANVPWSLNDDQPWLTVNQTSGTGNEKLVFTANANPAYTDRKATVTISAVGMPSQTITVVQYGIPKTFAVSAGNLSNTLTANEKNTTSNMKLIGTIDARDFKTMRDNMPSLSNVDLSSVTISEYTGTLGTKGTNSTFYPSNVIPEYAFCTPVSLVGKNVLNSVILPASASSIGSYAFYGCTNMTRFMFSPSVTTIGDYAFYGCSNLNTIDFPPLLASIGNYSFYSCKGLTSVTNQSLLTSIGNNAFSKCLGLTSFTFPTTLKTIGNYAFESCKRLASISIPELVTTIGYHAFDGCCHLKSASIASALTKIESYLFYGCNDLATFAIPATVTSIGSYAFGYCNSLTSLIIPPLVQTIGLRSFTYCTGLTSIEIPDGVTSIGASAFYNCSGLISATLPSTISVIDDYTFSNCTMLSSLNIPTSVKTIGHHALQNCNFTVIDIPSSVTTIGNYAFANNDKLTSITIPTSVTTIGEYVFSWCTSLPTVKIPNTITRIGPSFFSWATNLSSITIPASINYIGNMAFYNCSRLASITCNKEIPVDIVNSSQVFSGVNKNTCILYVPFRSRGLYTAANQWKDFVNIVELPPLIPSNLEIADSTIGNGQNTCFNAYDTITVAGMDTVLVESGSVSELIAGRIIRFLPGFHAKTGSTLYAHITTDSTFCEGKGGQSIVYQEPEEKAQSTHALLHSPHSPNIKDKQLKIFPNPNYGKCTIELKNYSGRYEISLVNPSGAMVFKTENEGNRSIQLDLSHLGKGLYFVTIHNNKDRKTEKVIIR